MGDCPFSFLFLSGNLELPRQFAAFRVELGPMKTTTFSLLLSLVFLAACNPRDPDVLTKDDKAMIEGRRNKNSGDSQSGPGKARLPQKMEMALGVLAENRISQAQQILSLATELASKNVDKKGCVSIRPLSANGNAKNFRLSYNYKCNPGTDAFDVNMMGLADLLLQLNEKGELLSLKFSTRPLSEDSFDSMTIRAFSKSSKDTLMIRDSLTLSMVRLDATDTFSIVDSSSNSILQNGYQDTATTIHLANLFDGILSDKGVVSWHFDIQGDGRNDGATGAPVFFTLTVDQPAAADSADFTFQMGKTKRIGKLIFTDADVTSISKADFDSDDGRPNNSKKNKPPKEDKSTTARQKSQSLEAQPALELWF